MIQRKEPPSTPKYRPFMWNGTLYQALGGGPGVCYLHFPLSRQDARLVLHRYPPSPNNPWTVADVYLCDTKTQKFERTSKSNFQLNVPVALKFNQDLNSTLPSVDYLFGMRGGCCCHYNRNEQRGNQPVAMPDIKLCDAKEHFMYYGADFVGKLWKPKRNTKKMK